jgi:starvation-inducible outer membrane lipoprotein
LSLSGTLAARFNLEDRVMNKRLVTTILGLAVLALAACSAPPEPPLQTSDNPAAQEQISAVNSPVSTYREMPFFRFGY